MRKAAGRLTSRKRGKRVGKFYMVLDLFSG